MKKIEICPFCGSTQVNDFGGNNYYCQDCEMQFTEQDVEFEDIRHKVSAILTYHEATEEKPLDCSKGVMLTIGSEDAQGLSELEKPQVTKIYHDPECIIWLGIEGTDKDIEFDDLTLTDAKDILAWMNENCTE